jgi:sugar transferase (PEP-CTERM system associated)
VIRIFNWYVPNRTLVLLGGELAAICVSFSLAILVRFGGDSSVAFRDQRALWKILAIAVIAFLCAHHMELHDLRGLVSRHEIVPRTLTLIGILSLTLAGLTYVFPQFLVGRNVFLTGLYILSLTWILWRLVYERLIAVPMLQERVYVVGNGERAKRIVEAIRTRRVLGMELVGWAGEANDDDSGYESIGKVLLNLGKKRAVDRVIVAMTDRRSKMPVNELLELRLNGIRIEDGTTLLEKISGQIEVNELSPSWMIFGDGFRMSPAHRTSRRVLSTLLALTLSILTLPLLPIIALVIKLSSPGPVLYRQKRVGRNGEVFHCYKFRTMRPDAEADSGPTWASDDDPRVTRVGLFLRRARLDEIPQLWNVLRGDMAFVGPRPERPEFVEMLSRAIPYYHLRHLIPPGITGWAQINYGYGSSVQESKEKLQYDLYYIRNVSAMFDLMIVFDTARAVLVGRGVR